MDGATCVCVCREEEEKRFGQLFALFLVNYCVLTHMVLIFLQLSHTFLSFAALFARIIIIHFIIASKRRLTL